MAGLVEMLGRLAYFAPLSAVRLATLASQAIPRTFGAGEVVFLEGEPTRGLWIIERGRVKVFKLHPDGNEHVMRIFGEGDTFNDVSALDGLPNPANAAALSEVAAWVIPGEHMQELVQHDGAFGLHVIQVLTLRVRGLVEQVENLALYSVIVRLARFLLRHAAEPAWQGPAVTRATIALHLATTPQTISTALRELEQTGALTFDRHRIVIADLELLRSIAMIEGEIDLPGERRVDTVNTGDT